MLYEGMQLENCWSCILGVYWLDNRLVSWKEMAANSQSLVLSVNKQKASNICVFCTHCVYEGLFCFAFPIILLKLADG